ncbi:antitoxin component of RelBE/YafQ-DinJ toxin-antitoxin module [Nocardioides luteus]|nr:hypothetical protein [Nocardioides luteus]MDR7309634.1 antitoxin component of RelBE/YafQ-DinJ toxin-antitoxin module [Nocardioides luteus]GGR70384.1 hypothetical protein GCM10010197_42280 [Nocardioides luteus]
MAYAAVVLIGLLVIIQTLSPDTSALHRVPRTLAGQADFTVIPPAPDPDVSGVSTIPSTSPSTEVERDRDEPAEPERKKGEKPDPKPSAPAGEQPDAPPSQQPEEPPVDPGEGEDEVTPPALVPPVGPIPGIMGPLLWPFVAEEDARPVDEAVPMFLRQLIAADAGVPVDALPLEVPPKTERETDQRTEEPEQPEKDVPARETEAEKILEDACQLTAAIAEGVQTLPGAEDGAGAEEGAVGGKRKPEATPECAQACAEPKTPVGSSPAADPEVSTDPAAPSDDASAEAPKPEQEPKDGSKDEKTCAEKSVQ